MLHVLACYSNPFRWNSRLSLARDFAAHMRTTPGVQLHLVELAYGRRPFELTSGYPGELQLRTNHELFHKENLLNLLVQRLPNAWEYLAVIDADFHFTRQDWPEETFHQLQHYSAVQLFSSYANLTDKHQVVGGINRGFAYNFVQNGNRLPAEYNGGWTEPTSGAVKAAALPWVGAPGGAWAFRRETWDAMGGMLDRCILGSGDWFMAFGLAGQVCSVDVETMLGKPVAQYHPEYWNYIQAWQMRAREALSGNIGYVDQFATHGWHGSMKARGYASRDQILVGHRFSPLTDVFPDAQGVLQLTHTKPRLRDSIRAYFLARDEDMPHVG